jgi:hypothetical protein
LFVKTAGSVGHDFDRDWAIEELFDSREGQELCLFSMQVRLVVILLPFQWLLVVKRPKPETVHSYASDA